MPRTSWPGMAATAQEPDSSAHFRLPTISDRGYPRQSGSTGDLKGMVSWIVSHTCLFQCCQHVGMIFAPMPGERLEPLRNRNDKPAAVSAAAEAIRLQAIEFGPGEDRKHAAQKAGQQGLHRLAIGR